MKKITLTPKASMIIGLLLIGISLISNTTLLILMSIYCWKANSTLFFIILSISEIILLGTAYAIIKDMKGLQIACKTTNTQTTEKTNRKLFSLFMFLFGVIIGLLTASFITVSNKQYNTAVHLVDLQRALIDDMTNYLITDYECEVVLDSTKLGSIHIYEQKLDSYE